MSKSAQLEEMAKTIVKGNFNVFAAFLVKDINTCIIKGEFPDQLKKVDMTLARNYIDHTL